MSFTLRGPLPFMKTLDDALAICNRAEDNFYVDAFMIEAWLGEVVLKAVAEYAEKKSARDRQMQMGQAAQSFQNLFGHATDSELPHVLASLLRFLEYDDAQAEILRRASLGVSTEHDCSGDYIGPKAPNPACNSTEALLLVRPSIQRWCEWLDAVVHSDTHLRWHASPTQFDPDAEKRELAALGVNQRFFAGLSDFSKQWWQWHFGEAAARFKGSPKWPNVGQAMAATQNRIWNYPEADAAVISLWPLLKRHNWTYRDLLAVIHKTLPTPHRYPLQNERELATYCQNVLGLHQTPGTYGRFHPGGCPPGCDVALRLCRRPSEWS